MDALATDNAANETFLPLADTVLPIEMGMY